jgi:uncharacterized membrane protein YhiD involved in acid resistance
VTAALGIACGLGAWKIVGLSVTLALFCWSGLAGSRESMVTAPMTGSARKVNRRQKSFGRGRGKPP